MNKLIQYINLAMTFISLNKALSKDGKEFYKEAMCLGAGVNKALKDGKVTNEELDELVGQIADTGSSLVSLLEGLRIPEEVKPEGWDEA